VVLLIVDKNEGNKERIADGIHYIRKDNATKKMKNQTELN